MEAHQHVASLPSNASSTSSITSLPPHPPVAAFLPLNDVAHSVASVSNVTSKSQSGGGPPEPRLDAAVNDALEAIRAVASAKAGRDRGMLIVAYALGSSLSVDLIQRCQSAGADLVLSAPFVPKALMERLLQLVAITPARRPSLNPAEASLLSSSSSPSLSPMSSSLRPKAADLLTLSDLSAPFANLCAVDPEEAEDPRLLAPRRASVDTGGLALTFSRAGLGDDEDEGVDDGHSGYGLGPAAGLAAGGINGEESGAEGTKIFAELVADMHQHVRAIIGTDIAVPPALTAQRRAELVDHLSSWSFRPYELSHDDVYHCSCLLFEATLLIQGVWELNIEQERINAFLLSIRSLYHVHNPYHNYQHGVDVLQATYTFLTALRVAPPLSTLLETRPGTPWKRPPVPSLTSEGKRAVELLRPQDVLTVMIAAIGHDSAHPGLSNAFLKNALSPLSVVYAHRSALENLHCILVVSLLKKHGLSWLFASDAVTGPAEVANPCCEHHPLPSWPPTTGSVSSSSSSSSVHLPPLSVPSPPTSRPPSVSGRRRTTHQAGWADFRKLLFGTILATDMSMHLSWIRSLVELGEKVSSSSLSDSTQNVGGERSYKAEEDATDRLMIFQTLIKCADISNPARPHEISEHWSSALLEEWHQQATLETGLQLPVSVVKQADAGIQAKGQVAFIDLFTQPLFDAASTVMPQLAPYAQQCANNRALWFERLSVINTTSGPSDAVTSSSPSSSFSTTPKVAAADPPFAVPCALDSRYRQLFPLTLPTRFLAMPLVSPDSLTSTPPPALDQKPVPVAPASRASVIQSEMPPLPFVSNSNGFPTGGGGGGSGDSSDLAATYRSLVGRKSSYSPVQ